MLRNTTSAKMVLSLSAMLAVPAMADLNHITGTITADNHYVLYTGNGSGSLVDLIGGNELGAGGSPGTYNWSKAESYDFTTGLNTIYIAAWSDDRVAQGLLAELTINGETLLSGDPAWEVFATGINKNDGSPYPTEAELGTQIGIANANAGGAGTSGGWTSIAVGGTHGVGPWGNITGIDSTASWMWYGKEFPFEPGADHDEYLIFRTSVKPVPVPGAVLLGMLGFGIVGGAKRKFGK